MLLGFGWTPALSAQAPPRDLVLITIDTWRHDAVPWQSGPFAVPAPALEKVAQGGRVFARAYAHNTVTLPSHLNILTGLYPYQHGVRDNAGFLLPAAVPTLASLLGQEGFATGAFVSALTLDARFGLARGFEVYDQPRGNKQGAAMFEVGERPAAVTVEKAIAWWRKNAGRRRFLWLHLFDPHAPYEPPEPYRKLFAEDPYRGEIAATDHFLAALLAGFEKDGVLLVLTADHGEGRGEHGEATHGSFAWDGTLRVPLLLWGKGVSAGKEDRLARHIDIAPTLLEAVGLKKPKFSLGTSLLRPTESAETTSYFEALTGHFSFGWAPLRGLVQGFSKIYEKPLPELYDLKADPGEQHNLEATERRRLNALRRLLPQESSWPPTRQGEVAPEVAATLRSLGYLSESAPRQQNYGPEDDPHRLADLEAGVLAAESFFSAGRYAEAAAKAAEVLKRRDTVPAAYTLRAQALLALGKKAEALAGMEEAVAKKSASRELWQQMGLTLLELGRAKEAATRLAPEVERGSEGRLQSIYALALAESGKEAEGLAVMRQAAKASPADAEVLERLSALALGTQHVGEAEEAARAAVAADPGRAYAWNNLGVALFLRGSRREALDAWEKAVALQPDLWDTWFNLGTKAAELGDARAGAALKTFVDKAPSGRYRAELARARALLEHRE